MQCQQTQKQEATLLLVNQDLQEGQGNPSGPRVPHMWEGGRCSDEATESQNSWSWNGRSGECHKSSFKSSIIMCNLNDILGNVAKCEPVPFQVGWHGFLAETCWDLFPFPCLLLLSDCTHTSCKHTGCSASCCSQPRLPTATVLLWVYIPHPTHHSSHVTGAPENSGSYLFNQLPLLLPLISSTITLAANKFNPYSLKTYSRGKQFVLSHKKSCALL